MCIQIPSQTFRFRALWLRELTNGNLTSGFQRLILFNFCGSTQSVIYSFCMVVQSLQCCGSTAKASGGLKWEQVTLWQSICKTLSHAWQLTAVIDMLRLCFRCVSARSWREMERTKDDDELLDPCHVGIELGVFALVQTRWDLPC